MIDKAREKQCMLSVFHNRRWDSDYLMIKDIISRRLIGEVFHIEAGLKSSDSGTSIPPIEGCE